MTVNIQDDILRLHSMGLLDRLLQDKATKGKILWATDAYSRFGDCYTPGNEIRPQRITGEHSDLIKTRARRAMEQRTARTRQHAEVFTPLWVVKKMNDVADEQWFGRKTGFYQLTEEGKIAFTNNQKHWKLYVDARRLEITCGEAPFLATRYDVETGEALPVEERIGLLDRKLRVVSENAADLAEWKTWALRAVQSIYGYELQGDNLLIARVNVLCSVEEHMMHRWKRKPEKAWLDRLCNVVCWNLWQMDGVTGCVPVPPQPTEQQLCLFAAEPSYEQESLFGETKEANIGCRLFDWRGDRSVSYQALREKGSELMKFDFIIGNPPYQDEAKEGTIQAKPIYNLFVQESKKLADSIALITPSRWFSGGMGLDSYRAEMLKCNQIKRMYEYANGKECFPMTSISGGVCIFYWDKNYSGPCDFINVVRGIETKRKRYLDEYPVLIRDNHAVDIIHKVQDGAFCSMSEIISAISPFGLSTKERGAPTQTNSCDYKLYSSAGVGYLANDKVMKGQEYVNQYKVMLSQTGAEHAGEPSKDGTFRVLSSSMRVLVPNEVCTHSYILIGPFKSPELALNAEKYIKTKFVRFLILQAVASIHISKSTFLFVPLQNFSTQSDIKWEAKIEEIDQQLYNRYGLNEDEICFIESKIKEMTV